MWTRRPTTRRRSSSSSHGDSGSRRWRERGQRWVTSPTRSISGRAESAARQAKRFDHLPEVVGCFALERHSLGGSGMHESENPRVEHRAHRFDLWTRVVADIHAFADQGMAELGHVDANLMLPPGFEAALDQGPAR